MNSFGELENWYTVFCYFNWCEGGWLVGLCRGHMLAVHCCQPDRLKMARVGGQYMYNNNFKNFCVLPFLRGVVLHPESFFQVNMSIN